MAIPMKGQAPGKRGAPFVLCPAGPQLAVLCDAIDHGIVDVPGWGRNAPPKKQHKCTLRFQSQHRMTDGKPFIVQRRFTLSDHPKAALRKFVGEWRGRPLTDAEAAGMDLEKLLGVNAYLNVAHVNKPQKGGVFQEIISIMPPPRGMAKLTVVDYKRVCDRTEAEKAEAHQNAAEDRPDDDAGGFPSTWDDVAPDDGATEPEPGDDFPI